MNAMIFKTVKGQKLYLSPTGKWIKSKVNARVFGSVQEAQEAAAKNAAAVTFYSFKG